MKALIISLVVFALSFLFFELPASADPGEIIKVEKKVNVYTKPTSRECTIQRRKFYSEQSKIFNKNAVIDAANQAIVMGCW